MQGRTSGINMAGGDVSITDAIPMNSIGFFGLHCATAGAYPEDSEITEEKGEDSIRRLYIKDGRLAGYMIIGDVNRAGVYTSLVREKTAVDTLNKAELLRSPSLAVFSADTRKQKLGGAV